MYNPQLIYCSQKTSPVNCLKAKKDLRVTVKNKQTNFTYKAFYHIDKKKKR